MGIEEIKAELIKLRREIKRHNKKYYDDDAPEISDYEFDKLMNPNLLRRLHLLKLSAELRGGLQVNLSRIKSLCFRCKMFFRVMKLKILSKIF